MTVMTDGRLARYLADVQQHLADLPPVQRDDVLDEVWQVLVEVSAEIDGDIYDLLGPPDRFVAELRAASGLAPIEAGRRSGRVRATLRRMVTAGFDAGGSWRPSADLRLLWWLVRGFGAAAVLQLLAVGTVRPSWLGVIPFPALTGAWLVDFAVLLAAMGASVALGRRSSSGRGRNAARFVNVMVVIGFVLLAGHLRARLDGRFHLPEIGAIHADPEALYPTTTMVLGTAGVGATTVVFEPGGDLDAIVREIGARLEMHGVPLRLVIPDAEGRFQEFQVDSVEEARELLRAATG